MSQQFSPETHIKNLLASPVVPVLDLQGMPIVGILGRKGMSRPTAGGSLGVDLIIMSPESHFPDNHSHRGMHYLIILKGQGIVSVNGSHYSVKEYDLIVIPAELPHGMKTVPGCEDELVFISVGIPHVDLSDSKRMYLNKT